jgi:hypothetical protein
VESDLLTYIHCFGETMGVKKNNIILKTYFENYAFPRSKVKPRGVKRSQEETLAFN